MVLLKTLLIISLLLVFFQDFKNREVYWFLFPIVVVCAGILHMSATMTNLFLISITINLYFISVLFLVIYLYSKFKLHMTFLKTFALGDVLLFLALIVSFSSITFITVFIFALIFSLVLHLVLKRNSKFKTVPLAGYMSLFFTFTYIAYWLGFIDAVYIL